MKYRTKQFLANKLVGNMLVQLICCRVVEMPVGW